jgi:hypothetical protein
VHLLFLASIFVVAMASPAFVAVKYTTKPRRELALGSGSVRRPLPGTAEGPLFGSVSEFLSAVPGPRLLKPSAPINHLQAVTADQQLQDGSGISRENSENAIELLAR